MIQKAILKYILAPVVVIMVLLLIIQLVDQNLHVWDAMWLILRAVFWQFWYDLITGHLHVQLH